MNSNPDPLDRLLRAAARVPAAPVPGPSLATETRTLHAWRAARSGAEARPLILLWRAGLATAFAVAALAVGGSVYAGHEADRESNDPYTGAVQQLEVAINSGWQP